MVMEGDREGLRFAAFVAGQQAPAEVQRIAIQVGNDLHTAGTGGVLTAQRGAGCAAQQAWQVSWPA